MIMLLDLVMDLMVPKFLILELKRIEENLEQRLDRKILNFKFAVLL